MSGPAGAGRSTAIGALEDLGFEAIDNLPISFLPRLFAGGAVERPVVIGIDPRNRDFSVDRMLAALGRGRGGGGARAGAGLSRLRRRPRWCGATARPAGGIRSARTRRRSSASSASWRCSRRCATRADVLIDTRAMTPHELRAEMAPAVRRGGGGRGGLAVTLQSFSYKRGRAARRRHGDRRAFPEEPALGPGAAAARRARPGGAGLRRGRSGLRAVLRAAGGPAEVPAAGLSGRRQELLRPRPRLHRRPAPLGGAWSRRSRKRLRRDGWQVSIRHRDLERAAGGAARIWEWVRRDRNRYCRAWRSGPRVSRGHGACGRQASRHRARSRSMPTTTAARNRPRSTRRSPRWTRARAWWW